MVLINTIKFRLLRVTDKYVHETIRIMKLSHYVCTPVLYYCINVLIAANEDHKYIHDTVCKIQIPKFVPKSGDLQY